MVDGDRSRSDAAGSGATAAQAQRREAVRVQCVTAVHIGRPGERLLRCEGVDLSGTGLRAGVDGIELAPGEIVDVYLRMEDGIEVETTATVVRHEQSSFFAFHFHDITPHLRELLIRHVFVQQRSALAARRERGMSEQLEVGK